jgi:hypothetical protein
MNEIFRKLSEIKGGLKYHLDEIESNGDKVYHTERAKELLETLNPIIMEIGRLL